MTTIHLITTSQIVSFNEMICEESGEPHQILDLGKIESALHTAFYPGAWPFVHGEIAQVAGALCFHLAKAHAFLQGNKRTAAIAAATFLDLNGVRLDYSFTAEMNEFASVIEDCVANTIGKDEILAWFEQHAMTEDAE